MKIKKEQKLELKDFKMTLSKLIRNKKINFKFYNNSLLSLDLLQMCYDEKEDIIELEFRDIMGEHIQELRQLMNKKEKI